MNISANTILSLGFAAAVQLTAPAIHAQDGLTIACPVRHLPSQQAVGKALDLHNFEQVYSAREKLMRYAQRACDHGAARVLVSNDIPALRSLDGSDKGPRIASSGRKRASGKTR